MCEITPNELLQYTRNFLNENYGLEFNVPLVINGRLKVTYGRFRYQINRFTGEKKAVSVELNKTFIISNGKDDVLNILRHELIHYALFMLGKPHSDGEAYFERELKKHNTYSQMDMKHVSLKSCYKKMYSYECGCGKKETSKNIARGTYSCRVCKQRLVVTGVESKLV